MAVSSFRYCGDPCEGFERFRTCCRNTWTTMAEFGGLTVGFLARARNIATGVQHHADQGQGEERARYRDTIRDSIQVAREDAPESHVTGDHDGTHAMAATSGWQRALEIWRPHVAPRAYRIVSSNEGVERTLRNLAEGIRGDQYDLIFDPANTACVEWTGSLTRSAVPMVRAELRDRSESVWLYTNRAVVLMFADDERYKLLQSLDPQRPLKMICGNPKCICLSHISNSL